MSQIIEAWLALHVLVLVTKGLRKREVIFISLHQPQMRLTEDKSISLPLLQETKYKERKVKGTRELIYAHPLDSCMISASNTITFLRTCVLKCNCLYAPPGKRGINPDTFNTR